MTNSTTLAIFDGRYVVSATGEDYEASDHSVGLQGGFTSFVLNSAFNGVTKEDLTEEQLREINIRIDNSSFETERILEALDAAYDPGCDD